MGKFIWLPPTRDMVSTERIAKLVRVQMLLNKYRRENKGWEDRAIKSTMKSIWGVNIWLREILSPVE